MVPIPTPRFPFLASGASTQASYLPSLEAKAKNRPTSPIGGSRLRYWLHPSHASAHRWERASKPLPEMPCSSLPNPTIAAAQTRVKGIDCDICVLPHIRRWDTARGKRGRPISGLPRFEMDLGYHREEDAPYRPPVPVLTSQISTKSLTKQFPPNVTPWMSLNSRKPVWAKAGATAIVSITTIRATTVNSTRMRFFMRYSPFPQKAG